MFIGKKLIGKSFVLAATMTIAAVAQAQGAVGTGPNPYRDCGIGAALFPTVNWAAVSSNVIWDLGTTAVISATVSPQTCQGQNVAAAAFIFETFDSLAEETAAGKGEHIATLFNILEVEDARRSEVVLSVRADMADLVAQGQFDTMSKTEKAESLYFAVINAINS